MQSLEWLGHHNIVASAQFEELNVGVPPLKYVLPNEAASEDLSQAFSSSHEDVDGEGQYSANKKLRRAKERGNECWGMLARKYQISIDLLKRANSEGFNPEEKKKQNKLYKEQRKQNKDLPANRKPLMEVTIPLHRATVHSCSSDGIFQFDVLETLRRYRVWRTEEKARNKRVEKGEITVADGDAAELQTWTFREIPCRDQTENKDAVVRPRWGIRPMHHQSFTGMCLSNMEHSVPLIKIGNSGYGHGQPPSSENMARQDSAGISAGKKFVFTASENKLVRMRALQDGVKLNPLEEETDPDGAPKGGFDFGDVIRTFAGHTDTVNSVITSSDDTYLVSGSQDQTALAFLVKTGMVVQKFLSPAASSTHTSTIDAGGIVKVQLTSDDLYLMAAFEKGILCQYDFFTGEIVRTYDMFTTLAGTPAAIRTFRFMDYWYQDPSNDQQEAVRVTNTHVAVTVDDRISVFDVDTNTPAIPYKSATKSVQRGSCCKWVVEEPNEDNVEGTSFSVYIAEKPDKPGEQCIEIVDEKTGDLKFSSLKLKHFLKEKKERAKWEHVGSDITCGTLWEDPRTKEDIHGIHATQHQHSADHDTRSHGAMSLTGTNVSVVKQKLKNQGVYFVIGTKLKHDGVCYVRPSSTLTPLSLSLFPPRDPHM